MNGRPDELPPWISVIIVNFNGVKWMTRCLESLRQQTIAAHLEIIVVDNNSTDGSDVLTEQWLQKHAAGKLIRNRDNVGFCEGNNVGARSARGAYLLFLNSDAWAEPNALQNLYHELREQHAAAGTPIVLDYNTDVFQSCGAAGIDFCGIPNGAHRLERVQEIFAAPGCSFMIETAVFERVGGFPPELFMYAEETDLSWRIWIAGERILAVPAALVHHRGAADANPQGDTQITEARTNETKRFFTNRNGILLLLKNAQHILLLLLIPHFLLLLLEALAGLVLVRRWSYVRRCYLEAVLDCWRLRGHIRSWRSKIRQFRRRNDFAMLRFLHWRPNRWAELKRFLRLGWPKVDAR